jgi:hypothetical protein
MGDVAGVREGRRLDSYFVAERVSGRRQGPHRPLAVVATLLASSFPGTDTNDALMPIQLVESQ